MKAISKNMLLSIFARLSTIVTGVIVQRYILIAYGSTLNGLTSSISQVMSYLVLLEAGLGSASIQALYHPLAQSDWPGISGILAATGKEYRKISIAFFTLLIVVSILLPLAVKSEIDFFLAASLTFITGTSSIVSYILGGKYKAILSADQKMYVLYLLDIVVVIISCLFRVLLLINGFGIIAVQSVNLLTVGIKNAGYVIYVKKKYKEIDYKAKPNNTAISRRWNVLVHQISGIVVNHTDIIILTAFSRLSVVSVYSVYNMIFGQMSNLIQTTFLQAPQATFGLLYNRDKQQFVKQYRMYEVCFSALLYVLTAVALIMIIPFIKLYTAGITDIDYIDYWLPILLALILLMNQLRAPAIMLINITGAFKETQKGAIIEALINITVSLSLFFFTDLGLYGLLIGTVASFLFRTFEVIIYARKKILSMPVAKHIIMIAVNVAIIIAMYVFSRKICLSAQTYIEWAIEAAVFMLIAALIISLVNALGYTSEVKEIRHFAIDRAEKLFVKK